MPLIHITTCLLCADRKNAFRLEEPGFETSDITQGQIPQRLGEFQMQLLAHIQKAAQWEHKQLEKALKRSQENGGHPPDVSQAKHFQAWMDFQGRTALAQGTAIMNAYETSDPALLHMREVARLRLNAVTRKIYFTDADILQAVQQFNFDPEIQEGVVNLICQMRDGLLEQGKFAPTLEQPAKVTA